MEESFIHCFYLVPCYYIRSIKTPLMHTSIWTASLALSPSLSLLLIRNYEGKTKKSDSSFCRGPLMISLKWLTALNSIGNLLQSKQIWSVLETEPGGSLGEGCNMSVCMGVKQGEVGKGRGGLLMRETLGGHTRSMGSTAAGGCPNKHPLPHRHALHSHFHPTLNPICATFILIALMNIINISPLYWRMLFDSHGGGRQVEDGPLIGV